MNQLAFDTMYNVRSFCTPLSNDKCVQGNMLFRSDNTAYASHSDIKKLADYGIKTIIDIRSNKERAEEQDILELVPEFNYHFIAFDSNDFAYYLKNDPTKLTISLLEGYILLLEQKETVRKIIEQIASGLNLGGVLFHCSGGKDRTGLISMLVHHILGEDLATILTDYHDTYSNLMQSPAIQSWVRKYGESYVACEPVLMKNTIRYLTETYSSVDGYLVACGIPQNAIDTIRYHLIAAD